MSAIGNEVEILLAESGGWLVGVDARSVRTVMSVSTEGDRPVELHALLGEPRAPARASRPRCLVVIDGAEERSVVVDRTVGTRLLGVQELQPLPHMLRFLGAPPWWLGTTWDESRLVILIDLAHAARGAAAAHLDDPDDTALRTRR